MPEKGKLDDRETLDQAVERIVWEKTDLCGKQADDCRAAAIRQHLMALVDELQKRVLPTEGGKE